MGGTSPAADAGKLPGTRSRAIVMPCRAATMAATRLASTTTTLRRSYDGIAPARNSTSIASRIRGAELHGYEGGHGFLFQDPAALPAFTAFLQAPSS